MKEPGEVVPAKRIGPQPMLRIGAGQNAIPVLSRISKWRRQRPEPQQQTQHDQEHRRRRLHPGSGRRHSASIPARSPIRSITGVLTTSKVRVATRTAIATLLTLNAACTSRSEPFALIL